MQEKVDQVTQWILSYLRDEISAEDKQQLDRWIAEHPANQAVFQNIADDKTLVSSLNYLDQIDTETHWEKITSQLDPGVGKPLIIKFHRMYLVAALVAGIAFTLFYFYISKSDSTTGVVKQTNPATDTIAPGGEGAVLTLSDGSSIVLDSMQNGVVAQQGNVKVIKLKNGELRYEVNGQQSKNEFNILATQKGKQVHVTLPDGTIVWLNAASRLKYPTSFNGEERKVELNGEGYFEVAKDQQKPFHVIITSSTGEQKSDIEVLGTHFNINAYDNESLIRTTLLEGRVKVTATAPKLKTPNSKILSPGQQAQLPATPSETSTITVIPNADTEQAVAWKNGYFNFDETDIKIIMRQIERWYDVEVVYEGNISSRAFNGGTPRSTNIEMLLEMLEYMNVHFKVEGRKITVTP